MKISDDALNKLAHDFRNPRPPQNEEESKATVRRVATRYLSLTDVYDRLGEDECCVGSQADALPPGWTS